MTEVGAERSWRCTAPEETEAHAAAFAVNLPRDVDRALVIYLLGVLGAGKTTWARGFLVASGAGRVLSPTYALLETYALTAMTVAHLDLYRIGSASDIEMLGLRDLDAPRHLWLIEWPERGVGVLPEPDLEIRLVPEGVRRRVTAIAHGIVGSQWLERAAGSLPGDWPGSGPG